MRLIVGPPWIGAIEMGHGDTAKRRQRTRPIARLTSQLTQRKLGRLRGWIAFRSIFVASPRLLAAADCLKLATQEQEREIQPFTRQTVVDRLVQLDRRGVVAP